MPETKKCHIGLIADADDPVAQLVAGLHLHNGDTVEMVAPTLTELNRFDALTVTSHEKYVAFADTLADVKMPVSVILRRRKQAETEESWKAGLRLAAEVISRSDNPLITPLCLSLEGFSDIQAGCGLSLQPLSPLPVSKARLAAAVLDPGTGTIAIFEDEGRSLETTAVNWARLRRNLRLRCDDAAPADLRDILVYAKGDETVAPRAAKCAPRPFLFVVTNGVGLGHLTRLLAVAKAIRSRPGPPVRVVFWCFSRAAHLLADNGFEVITRQTAGHLDADPNTWASWEQADLVGFCLAERPLAVVHDGSMIDPTLAHALRSPGCGDTALVWIRRAMWQAHADPSVLDGAQYCDLIIEPGDLAEELDRGPTTHYRPPHQGFSLFRRTDPVTLVNEGDLLSRRQARQALRITSRRTCLISLGGSALSAHGGLTGLLAGAAKRNGVALFWAQSPLADPNAISSSFDYCRAVYPLGQYLAAFDGVISAAGYNSFHETMLLSQAPVLLAPTIHQRLDDQNARAQHAANKGWADLLPDKDPACWPILVHEFLAKVKKKSTVSRALTPKPGADQIASEILQLAERYQEAVK